MLSVRSNCVLLFAGDPYFVEYLEPFAAYEMTVRGMSEVGDGYPLKYVATTPDAQTHTHTHTHTETQSDRATERTARKRQLDLRNKIYHGRFAPERPARPRPRTRGPGASSLQ